MKQALSTHALTWRDLPHGTCEIQEIVPIGTTWANGIGDLGSHLAKSE